MKPAGSNVLTGYKRDTDQNGACTLRSQSTDTHPRYKAKTLNRFFGLAVVVRPVTIFTYDQSGHFSVRLECPLASYKKKTKGPFRQAHEIRQGRKGRALASTHIRPPSIRNGRGFCQPRDQLPSARCLSWCRADVFRLQAQAEVPAARPSVSRGVRRTSRGAR